MRTRHAATVVTGVAILALAAGTASGAAVRGGTWTVRPGGAITADAGQTTLTDTKTGSTLKCASSGKVLPAGGNLHWYQVSGCAHLVADGDPASLAAAYAISPSQRITSP